jgi:hypothetical protein
MEFSHKVLTKEMTIADLIKLSEESNSCITQVVHLNDEDEPFRAIVLIRGVPETGEILDTIRRCAKSWKKEGK